MNPFDWDGPTFLFAYCLLLPVAVLLGLILPRLFRPGGRDQPVTDPDSLAFLAGRETRFAEGVAARLLSTGALELDDGRTFRRGPGDAVRASDRTVLALNAPFGWADMLRALRPEAAHIQRRLVSGGLLVDAGERGRVAMIASAPYILLFGFGLSKLLVGLARGRPVLFLAILLVVTLVLGLIRWSTVTDQTRAGRAAVKAARRQHDRLRRAPTTGETDLAVALFGPAVLAGSAFAAFHLMRAPASDGSSSGWSDSSGSSGCGGDSGGSSGCGGCGGGGD